MRFYSRSERQGMRVSLRWFAWEWNERRDWQLSLFLLGLVLAAMVAACVAAPARAEDAPEPPVSGIACSPVTGEIEGCEKVFLPHLVGVRGR